MNAKPNGWDELKAGRVSVAIELLRAEFEANGSIPTLFNLSLALLDAGRLQDALTTLERIHEMERLSSSTSEITLANLGVVEWLLGNQGRAIELWKWSTESTYADSAGGVLGPALVWYGAKHVGDAVSSDAAVNDLRRLWKIRDVHTVKNWPGPIGIAGYILGKVPDDLFLNTWKTNNPILESRRRCRVEFWAGVKARSVGAARSHFENACDTNRVAILESEYFLARWENARARVE